MTMLSDLTPGTGFLFATAAFGTRASHYEVVTHEGEPSAEGTTVCKWFVAGHYMTTITAYPETPVMPLNTAEAQTILSNLAAA